MLRAKLASFMASQSQKMLLEQKTITKIRCGKVLYLMQIIPDTLNHEAVEALFREFGPEGGQLNSHLSNGVKRIRGE